jgi:hypothetical protein
MAMLGGQGKAQGGIGPGALSNQAVGPGKAQGEDVAFDMSEFPALANRYEPYTYWPFAATY